MGTLFSALDIGRAGLHVSQVQLDVTGHNIANVNKPGFSRQRVSVITRPPNLQLYGAVGRGPAIAGIEHFREAFLDTIYRQQNPGLGKAESRATYFTRIEDIFREPGDTGLATRLDEFFNALNDFASNVEEVPVRVSALAESESIASGFNEVAQRLRLLRGNANEEVRNLVPEINSLTERIAVQNEAIRKAEATGRTANDLRDDRDVLIDELSRLVNITSRERDNGEVEIQLGGSSLVSGTRFRALEAVPDASLDPRRGDLLRVQFADNGEMANITDGELSGVLTMRDVELRELEDRVDTLARGLMLNMNRIHTSGSGLNNISTALTSENTVSGTTLPLNQAGLPFDVSDGSFDIVLYDSAGNLLETRSINIVASGPDAGQTTLDGLIAQINASPFLSASAGADGALTLSPGAGVSFTFANDDSDTTSALGLNVLFTGRDALTMGVSQRLIDDPTLLTSGFSLDPTETGDNTAALAMAALRTSPLLSGGTQTFNDFYESTVVQVGIDSRANLDTLDVERAFVQDFDQRRQEVSGVNLDEEVTQLIQFQRAFEASARVITVADRMLETLLNVAL